MAKTCPVTLAIIASFIAAQSAAMADEAPMCHDMPMRQDTLDSGNSFLKENGGSASRSYSFPIETIPHQHYAPFMGLPDLKSDIPEQPKRPINHNFRPADYKRPHSAIEILTAAAEDERNGNLASAHTIYQNLLFYKHIGEMPAFARTTALEGSARTELLLHDASNPHPTSTPVFTLRFTDFTNSGTDIANVQKAILHTTLSRSELQDVLWRYFEAWNTGGSSTARFIVGELKDKLNQTGEAADILIGLAASSRHFTDDIVPFLNRHPDLFISRKAELREILPTAETEFQIAYFKANKTEILSPIGKTRIYAIYDGLPTTVEALTLPSIHSLLANCPLDKRNKMVAYFRHTWRDSKVFSAQYVDVLTAMSKLGWHSEERHLLTTFPQADSDDGFAKATKLASFCADRGERTLCLLQLHFALMAVNADYTDYAKSSNEAKQLAALIDRYPTYKSATRDMTVQVRTLASGSDEQIRKRQCLEMAEKLNKTAFELEKKSLFAKAAELYQSALEIKQINLDKNDSEIATQMIDVGRARLSNKEFLASEKMYKAAIAILKANPRTSPKDLQTALESYGQALNTMNETDRAETVYKEARQLAKNS